MDISRETFVALKDANFEGAARTHGKVWHASNGVSHGETWTLPNGIRLRTRITERGWVSYHMDSPDEVFTEEHATTPRGYLQGYRPSQMAALEVKELRSFAQAIRNRAERWAATVDQEAVQADERSEQIRTEGAKNRAEAAALHAARH